MKKFFALLLLILILFTGWWTYQSRVSDEKPPDTLGGRIAEAALWQIDKTVEYDPAYVKLDYPMGDVPLQTGVCTDVIVRALRKGADLDLQMLVHEDMKQHFQLYPNKWGLKQADANIDHRRVPNLRVYFERAGYSLPITQNADDYKAGDLVTCKMPHGADHIMIVSYRKNWKNVPLTIHNAGGGTGENDCLFRYHLTGHYRIK